MIIQHLTVRDFGSVALYDAVLDPVLHLLDTPFVREMGAAVDLVLCRRRDDRWGVYARPATRITARVLLDGVAYGVDLHTADDGTPRMTVTDADGVDRTTAYRYALDHCAEQDATDGFDGREDAFSWRLCRYRGGEDGIPDDLSAGTDRLADTRTFRAHLLRYMRTLAPEPIHNRKPYQVVLNPQGRFEVVCPDPCGGIHLSETEKKLFWYVCFLKVAEFWSEIEEIRDLHHEKKPLLIKNFIEFLDPTADVGGLVARTARLGRQAIVLTLPVHESVKKRWTDTQKG